MSEDWAIKIDHLSKVYKIFDKPSDRVREALNPFGKRYSKDFYALNDVSLTIKKGETVGIIGKNGAGKSTLLKVITGVLTPTSGSIQVNGRIASLLELGAGFNPEMTGIENIYMNGTIMGYSKDEMDARLQNIIDFADIGDFISQPVKMYSSGMFARLAFAVNAFVEPDILIVDEALSVGDAFFQAKCIDKMKKMMEKGTTVLFVSHDWGAVKNICRTGVLMDKGKVIEYGTAGDVVEEYRKMQLEERQNLPEWQPTDTENIKYDGTAKPSAVVTANNKLFQKNAAYHRMYNGKIEYTNLRLFNMENEVVHNVKYGQKVKLQMELISHITTDSIGIGYHLQDKDGIEVIYSDSQLDDCWLRNVKKNDRYVINWNFIISLREGKYNFAIVSGIPVNIKDRKVQCCDFIPCALQFEVNKNDMEMGAYVHWHNDVELIKVEA